MSDCNIELVKKANKAFLDKDIETLKSILHHDFTCEIDGNFYDLQGYLELVTSTMDTFDFYFENVKISAAGDKVFQCADMVLTKRINETRSILTIKDGKIYSETDIIPKEEDSMILNDNSDILAKVSREKGLLFSSIERNVGTALINLEPSKCLTFEVASSWGRKELIAPEASLDYAKILINFMRSQSHNGQEIESYVTGVAMDATEKAIIDFYASEKVVEMVVNHIHQQIEANALHGIVRDEISSELNMAKHLGRIGTNDLSHHITGHLLSHLKCIMLFCGELSEHLVRS